LEKNGKGRIVEAREEDKVNDVTDTFFDLDRKIQNETRGVWYVPISINTMRGQKRAKDLNDLPGLRLVLFHDIKFSLSLIKWEDGNGMLWEGECRATRMRINTEICTEKRRVKGELRQNKHKSWMIFVRLTHQLGCSFISVN